MGTSGADKQAPRGVVRGPAERGARQRVNASQCEALAEGQFICPEHRKIEGAPKSEVFLARDATNPVYITTVWGYGYKWSG